ncbi:MAG: sulfatase-like hydrolase/transferase [Flammeovirgaceae bacterium]|nr:sulfatase-like hydrolase/transferase [Flammeovirgaceae bacterium]
MLIFTRPKTTPIPLFITSTKTKEIKGPFLSTHLTRHLTIHCKHHREYIDKYKGKFDMGWDSLRTLRLSNLKALGIISADVNSFAPSGIPKWSTLSTAEKVEIARDMEVYAAMIEYLDMSIGRLLDYLKQQGLYDNTLIVFMSDNGANGVMATTYPGNGDGKYLGAFNNELDNRGLPNSFIEMGPGWAQASSSPFRLFKSFASRGRYQSSFDD